MVDWSEARGGLACFSFTDVSLSRVNIRPPQAAHWSASDQLQQDLLCIAVICLFTMTGTLVVWIAYDELVCICGLLGDMGYLGIIMSSRLQRAGVGVRAKRWASLSWHGWHMQPHTGFYDPVCETHTQHYQLIVNPGSRSRQGRHPAL